MKLLLDTCVLFPAVMREMLIGCAKAGGFAPLWSEGILDEWRHVAGKLGPLDKLQAESDMALLGADFPKACIHVEPAQLRAFWLPDAADIHVLAAASIGGADGIITLNNKDFPSNLLAEHDLLRINPDAFLTQICAQHPEMLMPVAKRVLAQANTMSEKDWSLRSLMKKARMPRLGKALERLDS